jgi:AcrR family transcriptional regulator
MTSIRHKVPTSPTTEDAYLDAAREAILAVGWSRTTLTDIARRAGVSRMTLYRRWPDTQTLLADLMTREWGSVVALAAQLAESRSTARERITSGVVATVQALRENDLVRRIVDVDPEVLLPYLLDRRGRSQQYVADATAALVEEGQRDGSVRPGDPTTLARALVLAAHGFVLSAHTMVDDPARGPHAHRDVDVSHLDAELTRLVDRFLAPEMEP